MRFRPAVRLAILACLATAAALAAAPEVAAYALAPAPGLLQPLDGTADGPALEVEAAGQELAVPLPEGLPEAPVDTELTLPMTGVSLGLDTAGGAEGARSSGARPSTGRESVLDAVPPAAVAVAGTGLLAVLLGAVGMGLFSRIEGPAVLEHPTRARLLELVGEQPGLTILQVQESLGTAWGTTVHHVRRLEANGLLATVRQGPRVLLYAANTPEAKARRDLALLHNGTAREVARAVAGAPGIRTNAVSVTLGIGAPSASKHLARFAAAGLVEHPETGGFVATDRLRQALAMVAA